MLKDLRKRTEGFTIIEVLIVLAIAGLILLIVFLAVPALQRNSRNTAMKNDVSGILGAITEYSNLNNGAFPTTVAMSGNDVVVDANSATDTDAKAKVQGGTAASSVAAAPASLTPGTVNVLFGKKCNGDSSTRAVSVYYAVEASSGTPVQCQDS